LMLATNTPWPQDGVAFEKAFVRLQCH